MSALVSAHATTTHTFVLVHGAFFGGWVWKNVLAGLRGEGHVATAPTLTGIGERRHLHKDTADLSMHIQDVVGHIEMEDLQDVVLVGWSYGGMVVTGVQSRIPERIQSLVYLDAFVPEHGKSLRDYDRPEACKIMDMHRLADAAVPPFPFDFLAVSDPEFVASVTSRLSPQPWRTLFEPVELRNDQRPQRTSYVRCLRFSHPPFEEAFSRMKAREDVRTAVLDAGHACMLSDPSKTVRTLVEHA